MKQRLIVLLHTAIFFTAGGTAQKVTLKELCKDNLLNVAFSDYHRGTLYTIDNRGALYKTDLGTGDHSQVGKVTYNKTKFFFAMSNMLYIIENDGSMAQINTETGKGTVLSAIGTWDRIERVFVVRNSLYAIENGSLFYYPTLNANNRRPIGGADFFTPGLLIRSDTTLHSLIGNGSLYKIDLKTGEWNKIGAGKAWKASRAGAVMNNKLYTAEQPASLFETNLTDGTRTEIDTTQIKRPRLLFSDSGKLYLITMEGILYEVIIN